MYVQSLGSRTREVTDIHNPVPVQRNRTLCNMEIGNHFQLSDATHASGGELYDPKTGNTYKGSIVVDGQSLRLRGYVGISLFGRTEIWKRTANNIPSCSNALAP
jgi:Uncharacterized protein conserved in bacteria (DUF2147)